MKCRHCKTETQHVVIDLGHQPASNAYLTGQMLEQKEVHAPLKVFVCQNCSLVQLPPHYASDELFDSEYAYFSSVSPGWVSHAKDYSHAMIDKFALSASDWVVEVASNDGYLLQFFAAAGIPCTGIEPTASTAASARSKGIESIEEFFGAALADELVKTRGKAKLTVANNVLAHVPDINDFMMGFSILLADDGVSTFEFPHLLNMLRDCQFDTIYHEHYSYLCLTTVMSIAASAGMRVFDVEKISTHGGSLRVYICHQNASRYQASARIAEILNEEASVGLSDLSAYETFWPRAESIKLNLLEFLVQQKKVGKSVAAYGAAAKGNTLLNYAGVDRALVQFVSDAAESKQGKFLPGSHIPILPPSAIQETKPDFVLILPWNLKTEIMDQLAEISQWGGRFVVAVPELKIFDAT